MSDAPRNPTDLRATKSADYEADDADALPRDAHTGATPRYTRRLSDKILIAFHHACDQSDYEIADQLLRVVENLLTRRPVNPDTNRRRSMETLVAAHERLWHLRHQRETSN